MRLQAAKLRLSLWLHQPGAIMPIDDTLLRLKAKTYGKGNLMKVAQEIGVSDDTLRRISAHLGERRAQDARDRGH
jgi:hypothetical protein